MALESVDSNAFLIFISRRHVKSVVVLLTNKKQQQNCAQLTTSENFVLIIPGATQFTVMLSGPSCKLAAFVSPNKLVLLTEYAPKSYFHYNLV